MQTEKHRIIIDTNLWISFLLSRDFSKLDELISSELTILLLSQELLEEIVEVAGRPKFRKYFELVELTELIINLTQKTELVQVNVKVNICRDGKDNFLLSLAIDGRATHLITGDKDLLVLHPFGEVNILSISDYLSQK